MRINIQPGKLLDEYCRSDRMYDAKKLRSALPDVQRLDFKPDSEDAGTDGMTIYVTMLEDGAVYEVRCESLPTDAEAVVKVVRTFIKSLRLKQMEREAIPLGGKIDLDALDEVAKLIDKV